MSLDKSITPGTKIVIKRLKADTAGILTDQATLPFITLWSEPGMNIKEWGMLGDVLTVVKKPRRVNGINVCRVATLEGVEGEVYWTELRSNCDLV